MGTKPKTKYWNAVHDAQARGIPFLMTFEEWFDFWKQSGKWNKRGPFRYQYVMARFGDRGPYKIGNVKIITARQNCIEHKHSEETKEQIRMANIGHTRSSGKNNPMYGKPGTWLGKKFSKKHREAISASMKGKNRGPKPWVTEALTGRKLSDEHRAKLSAAQKRRQKREANERRKAPS